MIWRNYFFIRIVTLFLFLFSTNSSDHPFSENLKDFEERLNKKDELIDDKSLFFYRAILQNKFKNYTNDDINRVFRILTILAEQPQLRSQIQLRDFNTMAITLEERKRDEDLLKNLKLFVSSMFMKGSGKEWLDTNDKNNIFDPSLVKKIFVLLIQFGEVDLAGEVDKYKEPEDGTFSIIQEEYFLHKMDYMHLKMDNAGIEDLISKVKMKKGLDERFLNQLKIKEVKWMFDYGMYDQVLKTADIIEKGKNKLNEVYLITIYFKAGMAALYKGETKRVEEFLGKLKAIKGELAQVAQNSLWRRFRLMEKDVRVIEMAKEILKSITPTKTLDEQMMLINEVLLIAGVMNNQSLFRESQKILNLIKSKQRPLRKSLYFLQYEKFYELWSKIAEKNIDSGKVKVGELNLLLENATKILGAKHSDIIITKKVLAKRGYL